MTLKNRRWRSRLIRIIASVVVFVTVGILLLYFAAQFQPGFYRNAKDVDAISLQKFGDEMEMALLDMQNDILTESTWQAIIFDHQVNGWLASDLPEKFPGTLPKNIRSPRIAFFNEEVRIAFEIKFGMFSGYVCIEGDVFCPDSRINQLAIKISKARIGILPIPVSAWADRLTQSLNESGIPTVWDEIDGDPVALITLPNRLATDKTRKYRITSIELTDGQMTMSGVAHNQKEFE